MADKSESPRYDKTNPFPAKIAENRVLSGPGSQNETRHFVVDVTGSGLTYTVGDSLGIYPTNDPRLVDEVLSHLGATGDEVVVLQQDGDELSLREALVSRCSLSQPTRKALELLAAATTDEAEKARAAGLLAPEAKDQLTTFLAVREFVDLLEEFPGAKPEPQAFVDLLRKLNPRLYSIASSPRVHGDKVHLTVAVIRYETNNRNRFGVCSTFKADRVEQGVTPVPVFAAHSHFGLPEDDAVDVIMIGPGTGVAPFRAFLQEREARGAPGRNWLFFGGQRQSCDFLYGDEFLEYRDRGLLSRLDVAFSRDQPKKIYVQDRLRENGEEVWNWLQAGAWFYVCGDAKRMAKDVDRVLHEIVSKYGGMSAEAASDFVKTLKKDRRYQRDVY